MSRMMKGIDKKKPAPKVEYDEPENSIPIPMASFGELMKYQTLTHARHSCSQSLTDPTSSSLCACRYA